jgi:outer membrane protein OmpA-like peptidoglycan-associated protein
MRQMSRILIAVAALAVLTTGCATKKYTQDYVAGQTAVVHKRVDDVEVQVEQNQQRLDEHDRQIAQATQEAQEASKTAREALDRAQAAGKLAEGRFLYEVTLSEADVRFGFDRAELSDEAKTALDGFAEQVKQENENVYLEIQGHTDSVGSEMYNERLGMERAETVRNYLSRQHQFPLHRMNVISYGEAEPVADNGGRDGREQNRRVALVVLQ